MENQKQPEMMRAAAVAELFGVSTQAVYRMARSGDLPCVQIGKRLFFPRAALRALVEGQTAAVEACHGTR